jgi:hypothetical protein
MKLHGQINISFYNWSKGKLKEKDVILYNVHVDMVGDNRIRLSGDTIPKENINVQKDKFSHVFIMFPVWMAGPIIGEAMRDIYYQMNQKEWKKYD